MSEISIPVYLLSSDSGGKSSGTVSLMACTKGSEGVSTTCKTDGASTTCTSKSPSSSPFPSCAFRGLCKADGKPCSCDGHRPCYDHPVCTSDCDGNGIICSCRGGHSVCECNVNNPCHCVAKVECEEYVAEGVYIGDKEATPYIYDGSRWRTAVAYVYTGSGWVKCSE